MSEYTATFSCKIHVMGSTVAELTDQIQDVRDNFAIEEVEILSITTDDEVPTTNRLAESVSHCIGAENMAE